MLSRDLADIVRPIRRSKTRGAIAVAFSALLLGAQVAHGAMSTAADQVADDGVCSLREAIRR